MTQPESFKVRSPPLPGSLPVSLVIWSDEFGPRRRDRERHPARIGDPGGAEEHVRVAEILASLRQRLHSAQDCPGSTGFGASVIDPAERSAACDPVVTSTMSSGATATELVAPFLS